MIEIIPYREVDGIRTFRDSEIVEMIDMLIRDNTYNAFLSIPPSAFMQWIKEERGADLLVVRDNGKPFALVLIEGIACGHGFMHGIVFSEHWGKPDDMKRVGAYVIDRLKELFSVLVGMVRESNTHAHNFIRRLGYVPHATIPGYFRDEDRQENGIMYLFRKEA